MKTSSLTCADNCTEEQSKLGRTHLPCPPSRRRRNDIECSISWPWLTLSPYSGELYNKCSPQRSEVNHSLTLLQKLLKSTRCAAAGGVASRWNAMETGLLVPHSWDSRWRGTRKCEDTPNPRGVTRDSLSALGRERRATMSRWALFLSFFIFLFNVCTGSSHFLKKS